MPDHTELDNAIAALGLEYSAVFVPQSQSRHASDKEPSLNWRVTIKKGANVLTTDYMQGIGHLPEEFRRHMQAQKGMGPRGREIIERKVAETGRTGRILASLDIITGGKPLPAPTLRDVLYCLVMDAGVMDYATFEDWAQEYGYDADSRKAEATYRACLEIALQLRAMIGDAGLTKLQEAFQDY